ncbi:MAG: radical SAM protein [Proteobacteria bacterium]|nr:radical SAM protein [Pseudomonadota bacterium]
MSKRNNQTFHNKHELYTDKAYNTPGLPPDRYVFILTNLCNLRCDFCFQSRKKHKNSMEADEWIQLLDQIPKGSRITLTGGEPLLFSGFLEIFKKIVKRFDCNIISNGVLLGEETIELLLSFPNFKVLSIAIDNIGNTVRDMDQKKWVHVKGMMRHFTKRRDELGSDCVLESKTLILDENAGDLGNIRKCCVEELSCDHQSFQFLKGSPIQHADHMFPIEEIVKKSKADVYKNFNVITEELDRIREYNLLTGKPAFLHPKVASLTSQEPLPKIDYMNSSEYDPERFLPCKFPWSSVHINCTGDVFPCLAVCLGNVRTRSLQEIIDGDISSRFRELIRAKGTINACNRCGWLRPRA